MSFDDEFDQMQAARAAQMDPPFIRASTLAGKPVPDRRWIVEGWIPDRTVSLFGGDGGTGKSLVAQQLACSVALGLPWLGMATSTGPVIYVSAEDDLDELHRRLDAIARQAGKSAALRRASRSAVSLIPLSKYVSSSPQPSAASAVRSAVLFGTWFCRAVALPPPRQAQGLAARGNPIRQVPEGVPVRQPSCSPPSPSIGYES